MSPSHLDTGGGGSRPTKKDARRSPIGSNSSDEEETWHSTPASPAMKPTANDADTTALSTETDKSSSQTKPLTELSPATAFPEVGGVVGSRQGFDLDEQGSVRPGSGHGQMHMQSGDNFSDIALDDQRSSIPSSVAASDAEEAARVFATPPQSSTPKLPPFPARPPVARVSAASNLAGDGDGDDAVFDERPSSSSAAGKGPAPPLPPRYSSQSFGGAPIFPPPPKRRSQRVSGRPMSMASVMSGTASPSSSTTSPRSSSFYPPNYLNRPLPQTPTSVVSGGSRPSSYSFFSPTTFMPSATLATFSSNTSQTRPLSMAMDVPRPLRLQPSLPIRKGTSTPGSSSNGHAGGAGDDAGDDAGYDMAWLRAHQAAARMARRRQREQHLGPEAFERHRQRLESHEGTFEVVACFLQRLAHAENDALEPANFPHSLAEQKRQQEAMELMRQETVEALTPLLAYGPTEPPPPARHVSSAKTPHMSAAATASSKKSGPVPGHVVGLPPTPPLSPRRHDPRRESGMSSITETSLSGGHSDDSSSIHGSARPASDTWRQSMKRASALFGGWGGGGGSSSTAPASTTRFSGD
ncbi:hypothetical protein SPBR_03935 [Sporothrix brasiliensis 5110]|uniref:Uncharacterized protein n=1 Tax=Sporothrix brasiliensis 5110 TaxID=1398154 RepID=A0A0C2JE91_9PEZI|nr:uncharacterized protein SPBR_03935 [Sporothrix brasiliensis 5110]KIH95272.1 hypothetical protein SPBR_03935 [Sporothrix brasiliensis 5110]